MRDILKRKFAEVEVEENPCYSPSSSSSSSSSSPSSLSSPASSEWESDGEGSSSELQDFTPHSPASASSLPSKFAPLLFFFQIMQTFLSYQSVFTSAFYRSVSYQPAAEVMTEWYENVSPEPNSDKTCREGPAFAELARGCRSFAWAIGSSGINLNSTVTLNQSHKMALFRNEAAPAISCIIYPDNCQTRGWTNEEYIGERCERIQKNIYI